VVNLAAVASLAGVDTSTASRVLSGPSNYRVNESTRARILAAAAQLDYRPNLLARGLRTARTRTLAIVVPRINTAVYAEIVAGAARAVRARDYTLLIVQHDDDGEGDAIYRKVAQTNQVDGLIVAPHKAGPSFVAALASMAIPVVIVHRKIRGLSHCVTLDSYAATKLAINHLIDLGHRRIAYVARRAGFYNDSRRLAGFKAALLDAGIEIDPSFIVHADHTHEGARFAVNALLKAGSSPPTAIFNVSLMAASGSLSALDDHGLRVPDDVSVIALYDDPYASVLQPSITTVRMPLQEMGAKAADVLLDLLEGRAAPSAFSLPAGALVVRASTGPIKGTSRRSDI
jgi:LacI family transcriptional regulator